MKQFLSILIIVLLTKPCFSQTSSVPFSMSVPDSIAPDTTSGRGQNQADENKIRIVKRKINYGKFVMLAIGTMIYVALVITTAQAWNPGARTP
jgi:hypothetical protein